MITCTTSSFLGNLFLTIPFALALCPRFDSCMEEVVSKEEDVEIGRCVTKYLDIECTHAWEVKFKKKIM